MVLLVLTVVLVVQNALQLAGTVAIVGLTGLMLARDGKRD